jgi:hypothetical protein
MGLAYLRNKWARVDSNLGNLPKQSDYDFVVLCSSTAETQSNIAIHELKNLRLWGSVNSAVAGLKTQLEDAQDEMKEMSG